MNNKLTIFIVEDDEWYGQILHYHLSMNPDYDVKVFMTGKECLDNLYQRPDLITIDFSLPDMSGDKLFKEIRVTAPYVPVIVISAQEKIATAVELLKMGISDYFIKDDNTKELLWNAIIKIRENISLKEEIRVLRAQLVDKYDFTNLIKGNSPAILKIFALMEKAAKTVINVSITGETGTGKELVAKAIHMNSDRREKPFVAINMAAIPTELMESELFGHEKGAFTGAIGRKTGKFEEANHGTLFLDEIGELDMAVQSKLLRVLQERTLQRVGGSEKIILDVRIIVATHKDLAEEVAKGKFREDLYYRVIGLPIALPPLRSRGGDIMFLSKFFLDQFCKENKMPSKSISAGARQKLSSYSYPGNIRELKTIIELAAIMCDGPEIKETDITFLPTVKNGDFLAQEKTLKEYTQQIIQYYLNKYDENIAIVARKLDIGKSTIYKMIQQQEL
ncbi:sigma-54-dependent transcriptional regulator [Mucilaginibacter paludis]|uniref:Two component, sigma54 specific, transcriptional regulator n=1 Tax=Mucilaginibacter paludis DSM 18603 TaxID=714943 RepID=H1YJ21_9SPHI|nr:sigma-54 dependent transcriptional regulator [Mucilaginibacter paludis]EHQ27716.1 putative two component, sigma54 specific, transcriptional regulator [Mucilaginibacter paludis DSM 18603]